MNLGYACINTELRKQNIFAGRTCRKSKFTEKGLEYVGELGLQNLRDLFQIVQWNERNGIKFYRIGSDIFPWSSEYEYEDLPQYDKIKLYCKAVGDYAMKVGQRLTFHPGPFNILGSSNPDVVERTMIDLRHHSELFDLMGFEPSVYNKINIHVGAAYKDKNAVLENWCKNYERLDSNTKKRLTIENDDKQSLYTTFDLYHGVHNVVGIPIVFDYHHHSCHPGDLSHTEALELAISTWPEGIRPVVHYSSARQLEDPKAKIQAHADYIHESVDTYGHDVDIMFECKMKEAALLQYRKKESILVETI
jgi:UV DNA damage endonuclease